MAASKVYYQTLNKYDKELVADFVAKHFLPIETAAKCLNLNDDELDKYAQCFPVVLRQNLSIGAFDQNSKALCALVLNSNQDFKFQEDELKYKENLPEKVKLLNRIGNFTEIFFYEQDEETFLFMEVVAVDKKYYGLGIGTELTKRTISTAIDNKLDKLITFDTSPKSLSIDQKLGMKVKVKINMLEYEDAETKEKIFQDCELPEFWMYVMQLSLKKKSVL